MSCLSWILLAVILAVIVGIGGFFIEAVIGLVMVVIAGIFGLFEWIWKKIK